MDFFRIIEWLEQQHGIIHDDFTDDKFDLTDKSDGKGPFISYWGYEFKQPTVADLPIIDQDQVREKIIERRDAKRYEDDVLFNLIKDNIPALSGKSTLEIVRKVRANNRAKKQNN